jgi:NADH-quinone oxidoreductase subunit K
LREEGNQERSKYRSRFAGSLPISGKTKMVTLQHYLILSGILFAVGVMGVMFRRNLIVILMSLELMLNAVNLTFIAFSRYLGTLEGQIFALFVMVVAAAEVAVGLAIAVAIFRMEGTVNVNEIDLMKW